MKQSLNLKVSQQLTMTPALQQAIRLLQLSTQELQQEIQTALEENMMLEVVELEPTEPEPPSNHPADASREAAAADSSDNDNTTIEQSVQDNIPDDLTTDSQWEDTFDVMPSYRAATDNMHDTALNMVGSAEPEQDLSSYLLWQLDMSQCSAVDHIIAEHLIDAIDADGLLQLSNADAADEINASLKLLDGDYTELTTEDIEPVVHRLQAFDPLGIAARNLQECLAIQVKALDSNEPYVALAKRIINDYFTALSKRDLASIKRRSKSTSDELDAALHIIQTLNPRPGSRIGSAQPEYVTPDVYVEHIDSGWRVYLNNEPIPRIRVNELYAKLSKQVNKAAQQETARNHLSEARWLVKNLQNRNDTLLKVAEAIVQRQADYFTKGAEALQPMILREIADAVELHESTVSRITSSKYMATPAGVVSFKYFFSSQVSTESGDGASSTAIQARIKRLISEENTRKPLSDNKLSALLKVEGINVARRTVAKYREGLNIPSSSDRKQLT